jgi:hypothetical protein
MRDVLIRVTVLTCAMMILIAFACSGSSDAPTDSQSPDQTSTEDESVPEGAPESTASSAAITDTVAQSCSQGLSIDAQKAILVALVNRQLSGTTAHDKELARLEIEPDARDHRQGGIWIVIEFNGDELPSVAAKKTAMDREMRDSYEALYTAECEDLREVHISGRAKAVDGRVGIAHAIVFKTKLVRDRADDVDWAEKEAHDFNDIWDTMLLNVRWRRELAGEVE